MSGDPAPKEPGLDGLIGQAGAEGWDFFAREATPQRTELDKALAERGIRIAALAAALDTLPAFHELMEFLLDNSLRRATFVAPYGLPMDQAWGYQMFREGQNSMAFAVLKLIAQGRKIQPQQPRET